MTTETVRIDRETERLATEPEPRPAPRRRGPRRPLKSLVKHLVLVVTGAVMIYPLLWMVVSSLRPDDLIFSQPGLWLSDVDLSHYPDGWNALAHPFGRYLLNSAVVVLGSVLGTLVSCSMAAYAFARMRFSAKTFLFAIMLITIMLPGHVTLVPQYVLFSQLGMVNTFWPLVGPNMLATDSFFIFLMVQFIRGLPKELDEAARIDGAGHARIFLRIILPLMTPALATTAIFTFIGTWNQFFSALIYLTDTDMMTVPVALRLFVDSQGESNWGSMFAMSIVSLLPVFLVFLFGQRFLVRGIATTGIK
ncbi:carbohydrate ABC transporter permease [Isoptericola sp. 4D.3]|jgi:multiple sugar transport system permease protein|uniref:Carbohydrate ABC transporter permease n=2 Tax=Isoptericola peretonis TaxID=2918523 RepID=A0ABT0J3F8_9MICO|nr:carbohydrate ABC transporter permease [Isoptericola sp. 4D.3]